MTPSCSSNDALIPPQGIFSGKLIAPVYLKEINSAYSKVSFITSVSEELRYDNTIYHYYRDWQINSGNTTGDYFCFLYDNFCQDGGTLGDAIFDRLQWKKLDKIEVTNKHSNTPIKRFDFIYNNTSSPTPTERLTLLSFGEKSLNSETSIPAYKFSYLKDAEVNYYDNAVLSLPPYLENQLDHWGFYNGTTALLDADNNFSSYGIKRNPNSVFLLEGTLNKITYPTGGATEFTFEPHTYAQEVDIVRSNPLVVHGTDQTAGGLRIKKISSYDPIDPAKKLEKEYFYIKDYSPSTGLTGRSSGVLGGKAQYYWDGYKTYNSDGTQLYEETIFSTQSILPASENSMGGHVGYSEVVEKHSDGSTIDYKFTNFDAHADLDGGAHG